MYHPCTLVFSVLVQVMMVGIESTSSQIAEFVAQEGYDDAAFILEREKV
jgi:hypothetical protein